MPGMARPALASRPGLEAALATVLALAAAAAGAGGCASTASDTDLQRAVWLYNEGIRWKRFEQAAAFLPPEARDAFLERYHATEDRLSIESIEVRGVAAAEGTSEPSFDVTVVAAAYVLPSTVLQRVTIVERWVLVGGAWRMVRADRDLAPAR